MKHRIAIGALLAIGVAAPALAQVPAQAMNEQEVGAELTSLKVMSLPAQGVVESRVTTGKPYSADAITEFVQVLGDGNKISRKTTVRIYRDGEGRTRREELGADGTPRSISIYDPVAHVSYVLHPATRTAHKSAVRIVYPEQMAAKVADKIALERAAGEPVAGRIALVAPAEVPAQVASEEIRKRHAEVVVAQSGAATAAVYYPGTKVAGPVDEKSESIGQKLIDGVPADGTRKSVVFPAGAIGNQQPITVMSEQWFSPDLDIFLMTRHSDPRTGETTYSLSNIIRVEPSPLLFEVPADYTVMESSYMRRPGAE